MAKKIKEKVYKEGAPAPYKYIEWLTWNKRTWDDLSALEQKSFLPFMVNRFLSMNYYLIEFVNELQEYTAGMDKDKVWKLYYTSLPASDVGGKYIKADTYDLDERDINIFKKYFSVNENNAIDYLKILSNKEEGKDIIENIKRSYTYEKF